MATLRDIKRRIVSVKGTQQITRAMRMVAAAKLNRAQQASRQAHPYSQHLREMVLALAQQGEVLDHPFFRERDAAHRLKARKRRGTRPAVHLGPWPLRSLQQRPAALHRSAPTRRTRQRRLHRQRRRPLRLGTRRKRPLPKTPVPRDRVGRAGPPKRTPEGRRAHPEGHSGLLLGEGISRERVFGCGRAARCHLAGGASAACGLSGLQSLLQSGASGAAVRAAASHPEARRYRRRQRQPTSLGRATLADRNPRDALRAASAGSARGAAAQLHPEPRAHRPARYRKRANKAHAWWPWRAPPRTPAR